MAKKSVKKHAGPDTDWFVDARFGMFIHWGLYALGARHEWMMHREKVPADVYEGRYFSRFNPDLYDPRQWARMAREAGMKYFVITTKHHEGFCLFDSKHTDYKAPNTPAGRDLIKPMVEAFRAEGLRVGFYYSLIDWHHPEFPIDRMHPLREDMEARQREKGRDVRKYAAYMRGQVRELLTGYGKIDILWFDFSYTGPDGKGRDDWESAKLLEMVRELQPGIMVDNRLDLPGEPDFVTPEQFIPPRWPTNAEGRRQVWEACHTFSGSWGYHRDEATWKSVKQCIWLLVDCVSKGGNLLMNVGPTARGEFDDRARDRLAGYGAWMRRHGRSIYGCTQAPDDLAAPEGTKLTWNPATKRMYVHLLSYPFRNLYLPTFEGRIEYAQFLHDASELKFTDANAEKKTPPMVELPAVTPNVEVPVIELAIKA
jgi:alpha-L-fucosidase